MWRSYRHARHGVCYLTRAVRQRQLLPLEPPRPQFQNLNADEKELHTATRRATFQKHLFAKECLVPVACLERLLLRLFERRLAALSELGASERQE